MNINVYLPDDLGKQAKEAGLAFSHLLREAVTNELERRATMSKTLDKPRTFDLALLNDEGTAYTGRLTGALIATGRGDAEMYLTDDERIIGYDPKRNKYWELGNEPTLSLGEEVRQFLADDDAYLEAMQALGEPPIIEI